MPLKALGRKFLDESYVISGIEAAKSTSIADATVSFAQFVDGLQSMCLRDGPSPSGTEAPLTKFIGTIN